MKIENPQGDQAYLEVVTLEANSGHEEQSVDQELQPNLQPDENGFIIGKDGEILGFNPHDALLYEDDVHEDAVKKVVLTEHALYAAIAIPKLSIEHLQKMALHAAILRTQIFDRTFQ